MRNILAGIIFLGCVWQVKAQIPEIEMVFVEGGVFTMGCTDEQKEFDPVFEDNGDGTYTVTRTVVLFNGACQEDELPTHKVQLNDFYIGKFVVTQNQWETIMGDNPSWFPLPKKDNDNFPVEGVSFYDVQEFINKLNTKSGKNYRLPTEAEWEYAARGGNNSKNYKYSGSNNAEEIAFFASYFGTQEVGKKKPNELGIYDMCGNVWEWCSDWYGLYTSQYQLNPKGASSGRSKVIRGGEWGEKKSDELRVSFRGATLPDNSGGNIGFRLVLEK